MPTFSPGFATCWDTLAYKHSQMKHYQTLFGLETFIETGTDSGDSVEFVRHIFKNVYSMELHPKRFAFCQERLKGIDNVHLFQGDSEVWLPEFLETIPKQNILFWIDAHYSDEAPELDALAKHRFSGLYELASVLRSPPTNSVIMVDDIDPLHAEELFRIAPNAELEMSVGRIMLP